VLDLLVLVAGFAVGALAIVGINGVRRGSRPVPVVTGARGRPTPPSRPYQGTPGAPAARSTPEDHGIRVNHPGVQQPQAPPPPPPPPPAAAPPFEATAVAAAGPTLAKGRSTGTGARLTVEGDGDGVDLVGEPVTLGRGADQVLRIKDTRASRAHAVVRRRSKGREGWELEDQDSANGTELNGHRIPDGRVAPLRDGDRIGIGSVVIVYSEGGAAPAPGPVPDPEATRIGPA
jgi:hypothetical protein